MTSDVSATGEIDLRGDTGALGELAAPRAEAAARAAEPAPASWHRRLAAERERQGLSIQDVAARLRLHPKQVAAIEAADLLRLPSGTYLRGFVRNYAQLVGLDPAAIVAGLESSSMGGAAPVRAVTAHVAPTLRPGDGGSRPLVVGGVVIALVVFAVAGWWSSRVSAQRESAARSEATRAVAAAAVAPGTGSDAASADGSSSGSGAAVPPGPAAALSMPEPAVPGAERPDAASAAGQAASPAADEPVRAAPAAAPTGGVVRLRFQIDDRPSWIEVVDARGQLLLAELQPAGAERSVDGRAPLRLTVGNASAVRLEARGRPVDLRPHTSANDVARVTID